MAHVQDRWEKVAGGTRQRTARYGKGKRWQARYHDPDGRERTKDFARKYDAERFLATVMADVVRARTWIRKQGRSPSAVFAERWLEAQTFGETTREATELRLRLRLHAIPVLGNRELQDVRPSVVQAWLRGLQEQLAPPYVRAVFTSVSSVMAAAVDDGLIARNPCRAGSVKPPKIDARKVQPWPVQQVSAVIDALPARYRAVAVVAAGCGLRQGEVFGLRVGDIDFLVRGCGSNNRSRSCAVSSNRPAQGRQDPSCPTPQACRRRAGRTLEVLAGHADGLAFTSREHKPLNRNYFNSHIWRPALVTAGVEPGRGNGMHALRHFYASVLIDAGEPVKAVAEYLGHADPGFALRVYAHLFPSSEDRARAAVARAFEAAADGQQTDQIGR